MGFCCVGLNIGFIKMHHLSLTVGLVVRAEWAYLSKLKICIIYLILAKVASHSSEAEGEGHRVNPSWIG